ncbi:MULTISPECIES: hypothetical protein [Metallosphaera]|uniref:UPF0113 domain-containing protein n=1 Tax=Metallosphaera cuprina (strain Ar-4) TaxID=1006006 RepID=F4G3C1_METCR|nr:hypothetical protein [Metallosphaera cuprina]AEB94119.1 conserved hypothetical protein [Metallosphaera cuprina Ar-4]
MFIEKRVRKLTNKEKKTILASLSSYGCRKIQLDLELYQIGKLIYGTNDNVPSQITKILSKDINIVSIGLPLLSLGKKGVMPLLPLGTKMAEVCSNKIVLPTSLAQKVLYGKPVVVKERYSFYKALLIDENNDFLSFVKLRRRRDDTVIIPILDIGWYLREGG